ncbi:MAG: DUF2795 domain-containing protein [Microbacteriaceae bacterium]|nr:DUF2795 domain-containing protein [Microbacteriaceae bacterium]MCL2794667.1 DUF2795 domain-containing protein [Microbacteriaceae bacterium]
MSMKPSPTEVIEYLGGTDYPADVEALLESARTNGASDEVLAALSHLPDEDYTDQAAVERALTIADDADTSGIHPVTPIR